jgi:hypothetical protein
MNIIKYGLIFASAAISISASASNYIFKAGDSSAETQICIAAASDNLRGYRSKVRSLSFRTTTRLRVNSLVANKLSCNNLNIVAFSKQYGAETTANHISRYLNRNTSIHIKESEYISAVTNDSKSTDKKTIIVTSS